MPGQVQEISQRLCEKFQQLLPLNPQPATGRRQSSEKEIFAISEAALHRFYEAAHIERERHHLGILARARVAFTLQQSLLKAGYPPDIVKQVLFAMLTAAFVGQKRP